MTVTVFLANQDHKKCLRILHIGLKTVLGSCLITSFYSTGWPDKAEEETEDDEQDEDEDDELDEEELIKQMLAKEQQKLSQANSDDKDNKDKEEDDDDDGDSDNSKLRDAFTASKDPLGFSEPSSLSSDSINLKITTVAASTEQTPSTTSSSTAKSSKAQYPVSSTGRCPYCGSADVKYIVIVSNNTKDSELPHSLQLLLKGNHAFKMAKGEVNGPYNHSWFAHALKVRKSLKWRWSSP